MACSQPCRRKRHTGSSCTICAKLLQCNDIFLQLCQLPILFFQPLRRSLCTSAICIEHLGSLREACSRLRDILMKKELKKHPFPWVPVIMVLFMLAMLLGIILRGRGPRGTCAYDHVYRKATCRTKQLRQIPDDISEAVLTLQLGTELDKAENYFTSISRSNFSRFQHIHELTLVKCGIEEIQSGAFADLQTLRSLDLRYNRIQTLTPDTFKGLLSLEDLYLSNNPIQVLDGFVFQGIHIDSLEIANCPALTEISGNAFTGAVVNSLLINRCNLATLNSDALAPLVDSLQELHLTNNMQPVEIPDDSMKGLKLKQLILFGNGITETKFLADVIAEKINLDDNPLENIGFDDYPKLKYTKHLSLARTKLTSLFQDNLAMLMNLQELNLEDCELTQFNITAFEHMDDLKVMDLSGNDIHSFSGNFAEELPLLKSLFLENNAIQTVPASLEPLFSRLDNLTLQGNPLHCNCELRWFVKWLESHRHILDDVEQVSCQTPEYANITHVSNYGFQCRPPTILNATFDTDRVSLVCTAEGDPTPKVTWISPSGKKKTRMPSQFDHLSFETRSSLTIMKDGNYTCVAENIAGTDRVEVNTRQMPSAGLKFHVQSQEIEILETPQGFFITAMLIVLLGYILRNSSNPLEPREPVRKWWNLGIFAQCFSIGCCF